MADEQVSRAMNVRNAHFILGSRRPNDDVSGLGALSESLAAGEDCYRTVSFLLGQAFVLPDRVNEYRSISVRSVQP